MNFRTHLGMIGVLFSLVLYVTGLAEEIRFNRDIRPILSDNCFACHGPDKNGRQAELRLDERSAAIQSKAILPGEPKTSQLIHRIEATNPDTVMPPPSSGKKLSDKQRQLLKEWIAQGAEYEAHWSFLPVPPEVDVPTPTDFADWCTNNVDRFVAAQWQAHKLTAASSATKGQWLRRVSIDLTGLPPTSAELTSFEQDNTPESYETVVDRLLKSEAYGERMANMWLDVARYADTFGYQNDVTMEVWPWRDWVIRAFNSNLPYDQFVTWQTAGDMLPNATLDQKLATAFHRLHRQTNEGGSVVEEFRIANIADRTTTTGTAFLGLTLECARCHDHKYDPIKQKDFYRFSAYLSNIDELGVYAHFTQATPTPALLLYQGDQEQQHQRLKEESINAMREWRSTVETAKTEMKNLPDRLITELPPPPPPDFYFDLEGDRAGIVGNCTRCNGDDEIKVKESPEFGRGDPFSLAIWVQPAVQQARMIVLHQSVAAEDSAFRGMQLTIDDGHPEFSLIHFWPGNAMRVRTKQKIPVREWTHLTITHDGSGHANGVQIFINGVQVEFDIERDQLTRDFKHRSEWGDSSVGTVRMSLGARFRDIGFRDGLVDDLRVFKYQLSAAEVASTYGVTNLDKKAIPLTVEMATEHYWLRSHDAAKTAYEKRLAAIRAENDMVTRVREVMTMRTALVPRETFVLHRGDYFARRDQVAPGTPDQFDFQAQGQDRLALARWLVDDRNPLVSRVIVNRFWHLFFGRGIVASLEDFGSQGTPPSHPELLDYLSRTLIQEGWDLKKLCRRIVLSATYRQSSTPVDPSHYQSDPDNVWLARGPKHRLSAEQVRDAALFASGLLVRKIGGPSVMPYQPPGLWEEAGTGKSYKQSTGEGLYRRSLYTFWKRTAPPPTMLSFDATSREVCTAKRELTTTPLQALILLNDPQYVEAARVLAELLVKQFPEQTNARWGEAMRCLISRDPSEQESAIMNDLYAAQLAYFEEDSSRAHQLLKIGERARDESLPVAPLAATTIVIEMLMSYDEFMMKR